MALFFVEDAKFATIWFAFLCGNHNLLQKLLFANIREIVCLFEVVCLIEINVWKKDPYYL